MLSEKKSMNFKRIPIKAKVSVVLKAKLTLLAMLFVFNINIKAQQIAFPGAEGFRKFITGGRGGKVMIVSNLLDDGPGSFREAVTAKGKKIVVFAVSGTIHLEKNLSIKNDVTIVGQTAPGGGICLADYPVILGW